MQSSVVRKALPVLDEQPSSSGSFSTSHPEAYSASFAEARFRSGFYALEADDVLLAGRAFRVYCRLSGRVPRRHPRR